jgi:hypothetical protein
MTAASDLAGDNRPLTRRFFQGDAQAGAIGCATLAVCAVLFLAAVHPTQMRCSPWIVPIPKGAWAPVWILAPMVALWLVSMCFGAVRWGWFARQRAKSGLRERGGGDFVLAIDVGWRLILVMAACALLCAAPIVVVLGSCYSAG